jgi:putative endonuclease
MPTGLSTWLEVNGYGERMAFWCYILLCADGKYYTGHSDDLEKRIGQHQSGAIAGFTSLRLPVRLMWSQDFPTRYEALDAELKIKKWSQAKKEALIKGDWAMVSYFAKPPKARVPLPSPFVSSEVETPIDLAPSPKGLSTSLEANGGIDGQPQIPVRVERSRETPQIGTTPNGLSTSDHRSEVYPERLACQPVEGLEANGTGGEACP